MILPRILAAALLLTAAPFAGAAHAQEAAATVPADLGPVALAAVRRNTDAWLVRYEALHAEIGMIVADETVPAADRLAAVDGLVDGMIPETEAVADALEADLRAEAARPVNAGEREQLLLAADVAHRRLRAILEEARGWARWRVDPLPPPMPVPLG